MARDARLEEADGLLKLRGAPVDPPRAAELYRVVAEQGDPDALLRCAVFAADGMGRERNWDNALELATRAAEIGSESAREQLRLLSGGSGGDWRALRGKVDLKALLSPAPMQLLSQTSMVFSAKAFAPPGFSEWFIARARDRLEPTQVYDMETNKEGQHPLRTATTAFFGPLDRDLIMTVMQERAAVLCRLPVTHHEPPSVISYEPGQQYGAHHDYVPLAVLNADPVYKSIGQRAVTFVTYLNDDFTGAATEFPRLGIEYRGGIGDAVVFSNILPNGDPDENTLHVGAPPESGRKWVLSQWIRTKPLKIR